MRADSQFQHLVISTQSWPKPLKASNKLTILRANVKGLTPFGFSCCHKYTCCSVTFLKYKISVILSRKMPFQLPPCPFLPVFSSNSH